MQRNEEILDYSVSTVNLSFINRNTKPIIMATQVNVKFDFCFHLKNQMIDVNLFENCLFWSRNRLISATQFEIN